MSDDSAVSKPRASSLSRRLLSAFVLLPLILAVVYWGLWSVALLTAVAVLVCLYEFYRALLHQGYLPRTTIGMCAGLFFCLAAFLRNQMGAVAAFDWTGCALAGSLLLLLIGELIRNDYQRSLINWSLTFGGACYVGWLLSHYILLRGFDYPLGTGVLAFLEIPPGAAWVYFVLAITWVQDSAAYFVGRPLGRHRLAPTLSPQKSWEGAAGGFVGAVVAALVAVPLLGLPLTLPETVLLGAIGGVAGPLGDLTTSLIKRQIGVKDFGGLIPGHGGVLDRVDSMLFTAPALYYPLVVLTVLP